ncbi:hypothetical protein KFE98_12330 [bacterium SCSIO 12741]|nr:hypothetical protein KFE98_12330 [bacterium SCSIO 12741]
MKPFKWGMLTPTFYLTLFLLSMSFAASAQNYLPYFRTVARAETFLMDSLYEESLQRFDSAFHLVPYAQPKDLYLAAQVSAYLNQNQRCYNYLITGFVNGIPQSVLENNPYLKRWTSTEWGKKLTQSRLDSLYAVNEERINTWYKKRMAALYRQDQLLRDSCHLPVDSFPGGQQQKNLLYQKWMKQADRQSRQIMRYTVKYGFPSFQVIGCDDKRYFEDSDDGVGSKYGSIILYHSKTSWDLFKNVLMTQLEQGNLIPKQYALIRDFAARNYQTGYRPNAKYGNYVYYIRWNDQKKTPWSTTKLKWVNKNRYEIGLPPYRVYEKKENMAEQYFWGRVTLFEHVAPIFDLMTLDVD